MATNDGSTALATANNNRELTRPQYLTKLFERSSAKLAQVAPKHVTPERMVRLLAASLSRVPKLADCDEGSLLVALMTATQLGLEPNTPLGHGYIIPVWNSKRGCNEAQFWPGYRGLVHLAEQTGVIKGMRSRIVRARDLFEYEDTHDGERWRFVPAEGDRGEARRVFAVAERGKDLRAQIEIMSVAEVIAIRDSSPSAKSKFGLSGPWVTHFDEMMRKTAIKRLAKQIPLSTEDDTTDPERPLHAPSDRFVRALTVDQGGEEIDQMLAEAHTKALEVSNDAPALEGAGAKPAAEQLGKEPEKASAPEKKTRAQSAKEKTAAAKPKDAAPPPAEPAKEPEAPPPAPVVEEAATSDAAPEEEEETIESGGSAEDPTPSFPDEAEAPKELSALDRELKTIADAKTVPELRAWYDATIKRWDSIPKDERTALSAAYRARQTALTPTK